MDEAVLVADYHERAARFLRELAASPLGPAEAAYWAQDVRMWDDEPGRWRFYVVLPAADIPYGPDGDGTERWAFRRRFAELQQNMSEPGLGHVSAHLPYETDPLRQRVSALDVPGDRMRWIGDGELGCNTPGGGAYVYPRWMLTAPVDGAAAAPQARPAADGAAVDGRTISEHAAVA